MKPRRFEGSPADKKQDKTRAAARGETLKTYEKSAEDRRADARGQRKLDEKAKKGKK